MNKKRILTSVIVASTAIAFFAFRSREPAYQGRPLSAWLRQLDSWPGKSSEPATKAIREIGTNAAAQALKRIDPEAAAKAGVE